MSDAPITDDFSSTIGAQAIGLAGAALLVDAAIETVWAGSPVRWWAVGVAGLYLAAGVVMWRMRVAWQQQLGAIGLAVFGLLAAAAWWPGGLTDGIRLLRQPSGTVLSSATLVALLVAAVVLLRASAIPLAARAVATLLAIYGVAAFALGAWQATAYPALFNGASLWQAAPRWLQGSVLGGAVALPLALLVSLARGLRRGQRTWHPQQIIALGLALVMVASGFMNAVGVGRGGITLALAVAPSVSPASAASAPQDATAIAGMRDTTQRLLASMPKSVFDVDQKAAEVGASVDAMFAFVRDDVRHEVYAGVLRGARGTLISHAGNTWDKAVLLASLLRHHGRDVRFARGRLTPDRAAALVSKMFDQARQPDRSVAVDVPEAIASRSRDLLANIEARWRTAQADVVGALERAGITLGQNAMVTETMLLEEAEDHVWVEYRDGDRWVALDPSAASQSGEAVTPATETFTEIPEALQHRVTFRVKVEQRQNQKLEEHDAFVWPSTAAALHGASVVLVHQVGQTPLGRWRATPVLLVDGQAYAALSFTDEGLELQTSAANALVKEASRQVQGVGRIGELFGATAPTAGPAAATNKELTAVWLDVEFADASGRSETVRREIFNRIGPVARSQGAGNLAPLAVASAVPLALAGVHAFAVTAGPLDPRVTLEPLASALTTLDEAVAMGKGTAQGAPPGDQAFSRMLENLPALLEGTAQSVHLLSQQLARRMQSNGDALLFYETTPRLAIVSLDPTSGLSVDLRRNALRVVVRGERGPEIARANLARGVLDGTIEDAVVTQVLAGLPDAVPVSTVSILDRARTEGIRMSAVTNRAALGAFTAPDVARVRLAVALEGKQQIVVAPERLSSTPSTSRFAWWQVDARTGETVGVLDNGLHGGQALPGRAAELQVSRVGARAMMTEGFGAADVAQAYKAGLAAGQAGSTAAAQNAMAYGMAMGIGFVLTMAAAIVVGMMIGRATK